MEEQEEYQEAGRGRSAKKRAAKAVENLAQRLAELPEPAISGLPLSPEMAKELQLARNTRGHSSRKRQIKHLAGALRRNEEEQEQIEAALNGVDQVQRQEVMAFHQLEELRDRLCAPTDFEAALAEVRSLYPQLDSNKLAGLARSVHVSSDKKAHREIFRRLRKAAEKIRED